MPAIAQPVKSNTSKHDLLAAISEFRSEVEIYLDKARDAANKTDNLARATESGRIEADDRAAGRGNPKRPSAKGAVIDSKVGFTEADGFGVHPDILNVTLAHMTVYAKHAKKVAGLAEPVTRELILNGMGNAAKAVAMVGSRAGAYKLDTYNLEQDARQVSIDRKWHGEKVEEIWPDASAEISLATKTLEATAAKGSTTATPKAKPSKGGRPAYPQHVKDKVLDVWNGAGCKSYRKAVAAHLKELPTEITRCPYDGRRGEWDLPREHDDMMLAITDAFSRVMNTVNKDKAKPN